MISVQSQIDIGTTFTVTLPIRNSKKFESGQGKPCPD
ncbi:hypothetical protein [Coleofasciculus sp.]